MSDCRSSFDVRRSSIALITALLVSVLNAAPAFAQQTQTQTQTPFEPQVGQAGKDVVWVPTDQQLVEKMLDIAKITAQDFVMDLGSGDGRNIIGAAKRGARAIGVEYNPQMVELSRENAKKAGVADRATFIEGDMYEADISKATALVLFLLPVNLEKLTPKFLDLKPGTRIVDNTFAIPGWEPDYTEKLEADCQTWCSALLWIVPAKVHGDWRLPDGEITFDQKFQMVTGSVKTASGAAEIESGRLRGEEITFTAGGNQYTGRVTGDTIQGRVKGSGGERAWSATRGK
jgi:SAM-dependent methyltransferase